ncbi:DNA-directed RNA polymerase specialized sigma subunit, sigma24 family [Geodermatophilus saharensis]|uniref:DNA-directed RNA polymerase specialized sigma subunit, sigma24 family n=1 Tax=Geodermatophilus saharensis TaxID=1137994 RepID=A0A239I3B3_9ACTN|nr:hypothetical protein [Geodermatophilus saharensis]SNS88009.1 DNA-directed RNA polymerase specialized sigma subunit, sigma24 family [Geodermatophilus saharensis]
MTARRDAELAALVRDAGPALMRTAVLLTGSRQAGEDLASAALVRAVGGWRAAADPATAARQALVDLALGRRRGPADGQVVADVPGPLADPRAEELRTALLRLEPAVRAALVLRHADGLGEAEVARLVRSPADAVRDDLAGGRAALGASGEDGGSGLSARLHDLADELTWPESAVSPDAVADGYRRRRRARAAAVAVGALLAAVLAAGVPAAVRSVTAAPGEREGPVADRAVPPEDEPVVQPRLEAAVLTLAAPLTLTSPAEWDRWLPGGRPARDDEGSCPPLADPLTARLGVPMGYGGGALPRGPVGCTWVPEPRSLSEGGPYDDAQLVGVGFLADEDGTAIERLRTEVLPAAAHRDSPCLAADVPGGGALIGCTGPGGSTATPLVLAVPDARGAGVWVLSAAAQHEAPRSSAEVLAVLVETLLPVYG